MTNLLRLAGRLTAGSGRESLVRLVLTGVGLAAAVTMLLFAAVALPALHAHDVHRAWQQTSAANRQPVQDERTTDPLRWRLVEDRFDGRDLVRVDLAPEGPNAPVPPGLTRLPGPGEVAVSPALRRLLAATDPTELGDRFPGRVTATVGRAALAAPDDLVAFVGHNPDELPVAADAGGAGSAGSSEGAGVERVRSIEGAPTTRALTESMRTVFVMGAVGLLFPIIVFVTTATRLAAARREQRLAALRLAGATNGQVGAIAAVEAGLAGAGGVVAGFVGFLLLRPWLARIPFDGASFYAADLHLAPGRAAVIALGVPALAVAAAIVSLRRTRISPLGVARRARPSRPSARGLLLLSAGMVALVADTVWSQSSDAENLENLVAGLAFLTTILGFVLSGPWLTALAARGIARFGRRAPSLLAARRLQDNPAAGFRAISGIILAAFVGTIFASLAASLPARLEVKSPGVAPDVVVGAYAPVSTGAAGPAGPDTAPGPAPAPPAAPRWPTVAASSAGGLVDELGAIGGVGRVVTAHAFPDDPALLGTLVRSGAELSAPVLVRCADVAPLGLDVPRPCDGITALTVDGGDLVTTAFTAPETAVRLDALPVVAVAAVTDGSTTTIEQARTRLDLALPGADVVTRRDIDASRLRGLDVLTRVSNIGLSLTLVIAGCSLAVAVAGAIVERRQPLALLRLAGTRLPELRRMVLAEAAAPLLLVATSSVLLGLVVAELVLVSGGTGQGLVLPRLPYWLALAAGLGAALVVVLATLPLLDRLTAPDSARFE